MSMSKPLIESYKFTDWIMNLVLDDMSDEDARKRARGGDGASINWIVGHLLSYRIDAIALLGEPYDNPFKEIFGNEASGDGTQYPPISELKDEWPKIATHLERMLDRSTDEMLTAPMPGADGTHGEKTVLDTLIFFSWHETYHMGSMGMLRKELGYPATSVLAMKAMGRDG